MFAIQCGSLNVHVPKKDWADLEMWDINHNESLDLAEFIEGYVKAKFFTRWQVNSIPISDSVFLYKTFDFLDRNHDQVLDSSEYLSRRVLWSFRGSLNLKKWDRNQDKIIENDEFIQTAQKENLAKEFDLTTDGQITMSEMAQGMFEVCDKNRDAEVSSMEFYLWEVYRR